MSNTLLTALSNAVRPEAIAAASAKFELPRHQTAHAPQLSIGAISAALATKTDDAYVMRRVCDLVLDPITSSELSAASTLLSLLLSARKDAVARTIARAAGARPALGTALLHAAAPMALGVLASHARPHASTTLELTRWLATERRDLLRATPPELRPVLGIRVRVPPLRHQPAGQRPSRVTPSRVLRASTPWLASLVASWLVLSALSSAARQRCAVDPATSIARPDPH